MQLTEMLLDTQVDGTKKYEIAMEKGVAPELARLFLPAYGIMVRWRWTASLQGTTHLIKQRLGKDSQKEFQDYAQAVHDLTSLVFPNSMSAFLNPKEK